MEASVDAVVVVLLKLRAYLAAAEEELAEGTRHITRRRDSDNMMKCIFRLLLLFQLVLWFLLLRMAAATEYFLCALSHNASHHELQQVQQHRAIDQLYRHSSHLACSHTAPFSKRRRGTKYVIPDVYLWDCV